MTSLGIQNKSKRAQSEPVFHKCHKRTPVLYLVSDYMQYGLLYLGLQLILLVVFTFSPPHHVISTDWAFHSAFNMQAASGSKRYETKKKTH